MVALDLACLITRWTILCIKLKEREMSVNFTVYQTERKKYQWTLLCIKLKEREMSQWTHRCIKLKERNYIVNYTKLKERQHMLKLCVKFKVCKTLDILFKKKINSSSSWILFTKTNSHTKSIKLISLNTVLWFAKLNHKLKTQVSSIKSFFSKS